MCVSIEKSVSLPVESRRRRRTFVLCHAVYADIRTARPKGAVYLQYVCGAQRQDALRLWYTSTEGARSRIVRA